MSNARAPKRKEEYTSPSDIVICDDILEKGTLLVWDVLKKHVEISRLLLCLVIRRRSLPFLPSRGWDWLEGHRQLVPSTGPCRPATLGGLAAPWTIWQRHWHQKRPRPHSQVRKLWYIRYLLTWKRSLMLVDSLIWSFSVLMRLLEWASLPRCWVHNKIFFQCTHKIHLIAFSQSQTRISITLSTCYLAPARKRGQ